MRLQTTTLSLLFTAGILAGTGAVHSASAQNLLLVPETSTHKVYAFNAFDGSLVSSNFIPADTHLKTPRKVVDSGQGSLLISDAGAGAIFEYSYGGSYLRTVATVTSPGSLAVNNGNIYVPVGGVAGPNSVQTFAYSGASLGTFSSDSHIGNPFDIVFRANDVLISNVKTNTIDSFDLSGNYISSFAGTTIKTPEQISLEASGKVLVAGNAGGSGTFGVYEYDATGATSSKIVSGVSPRGVYRLGNGNIIASVGVSVNVYNPTTGGSSTVTTLSGGAFQYFTPQTIVPEPGGVAWLCAGMSGAGLLALRRRRR